MSIIEEEEERERERVKVSVNNGQVNAWTKNKLYSVVLRTAGVTIVKNFILIMISILLYSVVLCCVLQLCFTAVFVLRVILFVWKIVLDKSVPERKILIIIFN